MPTAAIPDSDLLIDVWSELKRSPDRHGEVCRENYKRACDTFDGTNLAVAKVANSERALREWLVTTIRRRFERPASYYRVESFKNEIRERRRVLDLNCDADE